MTTPQDGATLNAVMENVADAAACRIEIRDLRYLRDGVEVFDGLNLTLSERRVGVIGRNGSGKSQLARLIAGLAPPDHLSHRWRRADFRFGCTGHAQG